MTVERLHAEGVATIQEHQVLTGIEVAFEVLEPLIEKLGRETGRL